ncbi:MAG: DUF3108 domain-containing protein [Myxococcaceae bacterium]
MKTSLLSALVLVFSTAAWADDPKPPPPLKIPSDAECMALAAPKTPLSFGPGEVLEYDLDAMGATAGKLTLTVLHEKDGALPVEAHAQTNTFFSKVRRVNGTATSYLNPKTLRPVRYTEDTVENEVAKYADVAFQQKARSAALSYKVADRAGSENFRYANDGLDVAGAIYLLRQIPLKQDAGICFDAYGIRKMWRVFGKVEGKEHISSKVGEFDAWHLSGVAVRRDMPSMRRDIHIWISDDGKRLPLVAVGAIDLGAVRATLVSYSRPDGSKKAEGKESLKW